MEDAAAAALLAQAFGRRLREGADEWRDVPDVVRSSLLLLYGELRRQQRAAASDHKDADHDHEAVAVLREQLALVHEELRLTRSELQQLREAPPRACGCCGAPCGTPRAVERPLEQLQRHVGKLKRHLVSARREQLACEEVMVRAAEQHARRLRALQRRVDALDAAAPRVGTLETHVVATQRAVKRLYRQQQQLQLQLVVEQPRATEQSQEHGDVARIFALKHETREIKTSPPATKKALQSPQQTFITTREDVLHQGRAPRMNAPQSANPGGLLQPDDTYHDDNGGGDDDDDDDDNEFDNERLSGESAPTPPAASYPRTSSRAHVSLRLRYHRERERQLGRLGRLRHAS